MEDIRACGTRLSPPRPLILNSEFAAAARRPIDPVTVLAREDKASPSKGGKPNLSHPAQQLTLSFLPKQLVNFCHMVVEKHHKAQGYSSLVAHLWHRDINGFIAIHKDLFIFLHNATLIWKIPNFCFIVAIALFILSLLVSWWIVWGLIPVFIIVRHLTKRMNTYYALIAALMLAFEISGNDFGGWVIQLPNVRSTAQERLRKYISESPTRFLDFYMPNRAELSQSELTEFAAIIKTDFDLSQAEHIRKIEAIFD